MRPPERVLVITLVPYKHIPTVGYLLDFVPEWAVLPAALDTWRTHLERLQRRPLRQLPLHWALAAIAWPLMQVRHSMAATFLLSARMRFRNSITLGNCR